MKASITCINLIKGSAKQESLLKNFCSQMGEAHFRLLLHTEVRWLSKRNCLDRLVELYDTLDEFLADRNEMDILRGDEGKAQCCYLADIFGKLNGLNAELQGTNKTLLNSKTKIFGFVTRVRQYRVELSRHEFVNFVRLSSCNDVSDRALNVITSHLHSMVIDFMQRFVDLSEMDFPGWLTQNKLVDLSDVEQ